MSSDQPSVGAIPAGASRADEGFWVAVLPFKHRGTQASLEALADDLGDDIVMGLMQFSHLRVVSRSSARRFGGEAADIRTVERELGARYVMEGSLRQAGSTLRVAVQLVDATTGAHLWAETYDRAFSPDAVFALQDDLVPRIVSTVADWYGVLPHSMSEAVRLKPLDRLTPMRRAAQLWLFRAHRPRRARHRALCAGAGRPASAGRCPDLGDALDVAWRSIASGSTPRPIRSGVHFKPRGGRQRLRPPAITRISRWRRRSSSARNSMPFATRPSEALVLNPMDGSAWSTWPLAGVCRRLGAGCELAEKARHFNPHHPAWYWALPFLAAYRKADYATARPFMLKAQMRGNSSPRHCSRPVRPAGRAPGGGGDRARGAGAQARLPLIARNEFAKWYSAGTGGAVDSRSRKAGLQVARSTRCGNPCQ